MKLKLTTLLLILTLLISGCNNKLAVKNTTLTEFTPVFKEYINLHGYKLIYENEKTGAYRIYLGKLYIPARTITTSQKTATLVSGNYANEIMTAYEERTYDTISKRSQNIDQYIMVRLTRSGQNINISIDSNDAYYNQPTYSQGKSLERYLKNLGYQVEFI